MAVKVGVLGSGDVGRSLARGFVRHGHEAMIGSRTPAKLDDWVQDAGAHCSAGQFSDAASFGEVAVLACRGAAVEDVLELAGKEHLAGKVLIDPTNPLRMIDGRPELFVGHTDSLGERVQRLVPDAKVVKAFNTVNNRLMADPDLPGGPPTMFMCGNDAEAKATVAAILEDFGWEPADLGPIERSRALEEMCIAWTYYGMARGEWNHAFKMLHP
jgi:8-hydroxy-5-deazaflavin:NADPH oxidoreductase